ncbi:LOW QUALITY PROTEIN: uncharacterized protein LOC143356992 [Halictus rubicundus]|uniref:LOW QUALITY PROTEIN: uncharacterized protein LOC143356992 n=1 Tax=Halictus rubicundus TaxID=77578 RepID=UPI0040364453
MPTALDDESVFRATWWQMAGIRDGSVRAERKIRIGDRLSMPRGLCKFAHEVRVVPERPARRPRRRRLSGGARERKLCKRLMWNHTPQPFYNDVKMEIGLFQRIRGPYQPSSMFGNKVSRLWERAPERRGPGGKAEDPCAEEWQGMFPRTGSRKKSVAVRGTSKRGTREQRVGRNISEIAIITGGTDQKSYNTVVGRRYGPRTGAYRYTQALCRTEVEYGLYWRHLLHG